MEQISANELHAWLQDAKRPRPLLLDVREPMEFAHCHIEGSLAMPLAGIPVRMTELDPAQPTVVICHHGGRSFQAGMFLAQRGFARVINLQGGVAAWARDVDPAMPTY